MDAQASVAGELYFKKQNRSKEIWRRFRKSRAALIGLALFVIIIVCIVFADWIVPYSAAVKQAVKFKLQAPSAEHLFGTDQFGRDILARVIHGGRISLLIAFIATLSSCLMGSFIGALAGFYGGKVDSIIMRGLDIFMSVPDLLLTMAVVFALGPSFTNLLIALTLAYFTNYVRLIRSQVLNLSERDYVEAAKAGGASPLRIIATHIIPNSIGVIIVNSTLNVAKIILYESTLSFLGLGMPPPMPEWGLMLDESREFIRSAPFLMIFPALAIVVSACSVNLIGDGLRDALDPQLKS